MCASSSSFLKEEGKKIENLCGYLVKRKRDYNSLLFGFWIFHSFTFFYFFHITRILHSNITPCQYAASSPCIAGREERREENLKKNRRWIGFYFLVLRIVLRILKIQITVKTMEKDDLKIFRGATRLLIEFLSWSFFLKSLEFSLYLSKYLPTFKEVTG